MLLHSRSVKVHELLTAFASIATLRIQSFLLIFFFNLFHLVSYFAADFRLT